MEHIANIVTDGLDVKQIRKDFPILQQQVHGKPLVYFDNGATTQKPQVVIDTEARYYEEYNSNVHRGVHHLSQVATNAYEKARITIAGYINAADPHEVIFTAGTTASINLVANTMSRRFLKPGDSVIISAMEHHSNIVPWQIACEETGAILKVIPINDRGELRMDAYEAMLDDSVKIVAVTYVSNTMGTINPVQDIITLAHARNIPVLLDAAQAIQHISIDVQALDVDFLAFSGHKIYGPTGTGVLYGKKEWLNKLPPYQGGGDMIKTVTFEKTIYNELPYKFEAGTPNIAGGIALGAAIQYLQQTGISKIQQWEEELMEYAMQELRQIDGIRFIGDAAERSGAISFLVHNIHPFDMGELLDQQGIAVRTGHHCTEPLMDIFKIPGTVRASLSFYNTKEEIDKLVAGIKRASAMLL
ncbi:cysteine desulfurase / selenocysteine lyase [Chitinophaga ginsengisegetis]|uniref:Cysteine desulfurase n=1 Tax=Chitinophaga ginsengisegetis TaxID=393003 RepID=A0A1T5N5F8_9BACT|nr:cysteine desulfurase [Chitinophaga ginsengisegetis]MDR6571219.1 cysteine desulfurase/selenocysteine lyase [Chitinophaga ginsengisegetis]MDR6650943.1 cysteine desulfurase/selenocysteine lyase [Chitinophaga ginsengisegetis]MDR6657303.1 cysteine desulfurase/selenocysteine lyase [Chitinophaga ginsengisegetis]SKC95439.1 cysteine desulfurase / selenocysteine lyase [Chitinophaga ginsengisegetis]